MMSSPHKTIMVFGVFDNLHPGHRYFLHEARELGDRLIVVVAPDDSVRRLKAKAPIQSLSQRIRAVKKTGIATSVVPGDSHHDSWRVLDTHKPAIIALGHDQHALREAIERRRTAFPHTIRFMTIDRLDR